MEPTTIQINGHDVDPAAQQEGGTHFAPDASQSNYILVHCTGRLTPEQYRELEHLGVTAFQYIAGDTYMCRYTPAELGQIRGLPYVHYANVYHPDYVIAASLKARLQGNPLTRPSAPNDGAELSTQSTEDKIPDDTQVEVHVVLHPSCDGGPAKVRNELVEKLGIEPATISLGANQLQTSLRKQDLEQVARFDAVQQIEEVMPQESHIFQARQDIKVLDAGSFPAGSGMTVEDYAGKLEMVAVADYGIDKTHPAFRNKLVVSQSYRPDKTTDDIYAHGTACSACVVSTALATRLGLIYGTAPSAGIFFQAIFRKDTVNEKLVNFSLVDAATMFSDAIHSDIHVHSNSYGVPPQENKKGSIIQGGYSASAVEVDTAARTYEDLVILYSAGNKGKSTSDDIGQIGNQAAAKNNITVGACETAHPIIYNVAKKDYVYNEFSATTGNPDNLCWFSSLGPTKNTGGTRNNGRIKPDVVAPGMTIFTALTQDSNLVFHPDANGHNQLSRLGVSPDNKWIFVNGTSFSTPLVAGCCAIIRRALRLKLIRWRFPATLVKAILVNGAVDMSVNRQSRGPAIRAAPSNTQGFGRVDLTKSLLCINDTDRGGFYPKGDVTPLMANSSQKVPVPMPSFANDPGFKGLPVKLQPVLKVTLCYADPPGALDSPALLNVLHLKVVASDKTFRYGNTNTTIPDSNNNVQKVVWPNIPPGDAEIWIECASLDAGSLVAGQKWSVAWYVETRAPSDNKLQYLLDNTIYGGRKAVMVGVGLIAVATAAAASRMSAQTDE